MKKLAPALVLFVITLIISAFVFKFPPADEISIFDRLHYQEILKVEIETDLDSLMNTKRTEAEVPATFVYEDATSAKQNMQVTLQVRGKFRRRTCQFPPLRINFSKKDLKTQGLKLHNNLKLVVHCMDSEAGDEYVLREYLAYKLYEVLSPESYRVQLLRVKYKDSQKKRSFTHYGILMEDEDELAERLNGKVCEDCFNLPLENFRMENVHKQDLFQYLIGNTDWSTSMVRNMKLMLSAKDNKYIIVPYDFDFSGFVSAPYASVDATAMGVKTVKERVFLGFAKSPEEMKTTIALYKSKEKELKEIVKKCKYINLESKTHLLDYLDSFYKCLNAGLDLKTPGKC